MKTIKTLAAASSVFAITACATPETSNERVLYEGPHGECQAEPNCIDAGKRISIDEYGQIGAISGIAVYEPE